LNLTKTKIGDLIFSYAKSYIQGIGVIVEECKDNKKPIEFDHLDNDWENNGYIIKVNGVLFN